MKFGKIDFYLAAIVLGLCLVSVTTNSRSQWGEWGQWSSCSVTCGYGTLSRVAYFLDDQGKSTNKTIIENTGCYIGKACPVDGNWTMWSPWDRCSRVCGPGKWSRTRTCANPTPANGGAQCAGPASETEDCNLQPCPST